MLKRVIITNHLGESMEYRIDGVEVDNPSGLIITSIDGLGPVKANINMSDLATTDGQLYNSARLSGRNIVIKALFTHATSIEEARLLSYKYFPIKKKIKFRIETDNRIGEAEGYVESNEPDIFSNESSCQISILCENPYFDGGKIGYTFGDTIPLFKFAFGNESLDEPLIKLSEEAEVTDERRIIYDGDADTGVEIEISVPSDDIMDTFKVTGIEITGNDGQKIGIDTSKMINQVPNTAPNSALVSTCSMIYQEETNKYKFFGKIPQKNEYSTGGLNHGAAFVYHDEMYMIGVNGYNKCLKWNGKKWEESITLPVYPGWGSYSFDLNNVVIFNDEIHILGGIDTSAKVFDRIHYKYDGENWTKLNDSPVKCKGGIAVAYRDGIHYMTTDTSTGTYPNFPHVHYRWNPSSDTWTKLEDTPSPYDFSDGCGVAYDNFIYIFGASSRVCYKWNGVMTQNNSKWIPVNAPSKLINETRAVVHNGKIHTFGGYGYEGYANSTWKCHFIFDKNTGEWTEDPVELPYAFGRGGDVVSLNGYIYILGSLYGPGGSYNQTYTEEANNIKLIENDRLVINTNKGKKSVTLYRDDNKYNVINALEKGSTWLQLHRGVNNLSYSAETGAEDMQITISANKWYEGV